MMIKFHSAGRSGRAAAEYLEAEKDHKDRERENVEVLRGDPFRVGQIADSLDFKHRYSSAVIAWAPEDEPTPEQINEVLDDFEHLAWAGLDPDRYAWAAIRHDDQDGGTHVHILAARVDLATGKSLNIAPPGWQKDYDPLRDFHNEKHHWARPDDPARARIVQPGHQALIDADHRKDRLATEPDPKALLTGHLQDLIANGNITNRADIIQELETFGEITRAGKNYVSVRLPNSDKPIRLKGVIYEHDFSAGSIGTNKAESRRKTGQSPARDRNRAGQTYQLHQEAVRRRGEYNRRRYKQPEISDSPETLMGHASPVFSDLHTTVRPHCGPVLDGQILRKQDYQTREHRPGTEGRRGENRPPVLRSGGTETSMRADRSQSRTLRRRRRLQDHKGVLNDDRTRDQVNHLSEIDARQTRYYHSGIEKYRRVNRDLKHKSEFANSLIRAIQQGVGLLKESTIPFTVWLKRVLVRALKTKQQHRDYNRVG